MKIKFLAIAIPLAVAAIWLFRIALGLGPQSKFVAPTIGLAMLSGISSFVLVVLGTKGLTYRKLASNYGFDLKRTLVSMTMPLTVMGLVSRNRNTPVYLIAFCEINNQLRFAEILATNNQIINTFDLPVSAITRIRFSRQMGSIRCYVTVSGLFSQLSEESKSAMGVGPISSKPIDEEICVSAILSRNQFDTTQAIEILRGIASRHSVPILEQ